MPCFFGIRQIDTLYLPLVQLETCFYERIDFLKLPDFIDLHELLGILEMHFISGEEHFMDHFV